jgi:hypothetical protein
MAVVRGERNQRDGHEMHISKGNYVREKYLYTHAALSTTSGLIMLPPHWCPREEYDSDTA